MFLKKQNQQRMTEAQFALDVQTGLLQKPKKIPSKYLYDDRGSDLFNQITRHPDYYLTQCEIEIINTNKEELSKTLSEKPFNLIELGPGEGIKSLIILEQLLNGSQSFTYYPIDISSKYIHYLSTKFLSKLPKLNVHAIANDFIEGLQQLNLESNAQNVVLFLGSSIGNFSPQETSKFLRDIYESLYPGDFLLIGFDLRKNIEVLFKAYNDSDGLTATFNLNLLSRMNEELGTNYQLEYFSHYATYNVYDYAMESYLISLKPQKIYSEFLNQAFYFDEFEAIQLESSYKYNRTQIERLAKDAGYHLEKHFSDSKNYFILSLWRR